MVEHLLGSDADPLVHDNEGYNAVHHAAFNGHKLSVKMVRLNEILKIFKFTKIVLYWVYYISFGYQFPNNSYIPFYLQLLDVAPTGLLNRGSIGPPVTPLHLAVSMKY